LEDIWPKIHERAALGAETCPWTSNTFVPLNMLLPFVSRNFPHTDRRRALEGFGGEWLSVRTAAQSLHI
jgi:hypothetical protein